MSRLDRVPSHNALTKQCLAFWSVSGKDFPGPCNYIIRICVPKGATCEQNRRVVDDIISAVDMEALHVWILSEPVAPVYIRETMQLGEFTW